MLSIPSAPVSLKDSTTRLRFLLSEPDLAQQSPHSRFVEACAAKLKAVETFCVVSTAFSLAVLSSIFRGYFSACFVHRPRSSLGIFCNIAKKSYTHTVYIPPREHHLHGVLAPRSRCFSATLYGVEHHPL